MVIGPFLQTNQDSPWIYGLASGMMISFILWGVETLWHMTRWSTIRDWETSSGRFYSSFDVCHEALSKDEKAAILADIEDEKQKKLQVPFWSNVSSTSTRAWFCVFVSSITLRCLELQVPISWVAATLWTKPTDPTLLVFWVFLCSATGLAGKAKAAAEKDVLSVFGWVFWSMLQQQDLFLSDFGGIQCLLPVYCGICRWTVATTKPWRKKQQEQKVQDAQRRLGILHHLLCFDICEGLVTLVLAVCPCQVPDWAGWGSWRGTTKAEGPRVHHFYVMNCKATTDAGDALCWCQIWSQIRLTGGRAEEMAEAVLLLDFFVVAGVWCANLVWRVRKGIVDDSSTLDAERCPEVVGTQPTIHINSQHINTEPCNFLWFWLDLAATISQQPNDTDVQFAGRKSKTVPRRPWDERWCFFIFSSMCHTEKRNRAQERDAVLLQELQEKELLDVMNLAVDEAALPCPLSGYVEPSFYGPFVLEEMSRVVSTLSCVSDEVLANTLSDINSLVFDRSHDFLAAGDWKERATESARTIKARSNVGS